MVEFCNLFLSMLFHLGPTKSTHKAILESCFHLPVTRVGETLRDFTIEGRSYGIELSPANDTDDSYAQASYLIRLLQDNSRNVLHGRERSQHRSWHPPGESAPRPWAPPWPYLWCRSYRLFWLLLRGFVYRTPPFFRSPHSFSPSSNLVP